MLIKMIKSFVSKKKKRYNKEGFNLDLSCKHYASWFHEMFEIFDKK